MEKGTVFTIEERSQLLSDYKRIRKNLGNTLSPDDIRLVKEAIQKAQEIGCYQRSELGIHPVVQHLATARIVTEEIGLKRSSVLSLLLQDTVGHIYPMDYIAHHFGGDVAAIIKGLVKTRELYQKGAAVETENFRKLLMSFAEDVRVILIMIADRVNMMRELNQRADSEFRRRVASEASYLYAPLAHRLGLYKLKSELEDISLKYLNRKIYDEIANKLNETKRSREAYIASFIEPVKKRLEENGLSFTIKGRTKSIHSIWNKIRKQNVTLEGIYDLFAIRVILTSPPENEKGDCWKVYSIVTDMFTPDPRRMRDWLSVPKNNGYESLHTTVMGPQGKWVEIQIRTTRMDEVAEKGLAAHWKYKGIKDESAMDSWLNNVRDMLQNSEAKPADLMDEFKLDLYDEEVFVFTPKGELVKLPKGATVLDFAFNIHSALGCKCVGAKINGKNVPIKHRLQNGDLIEVLTAPSQKPKQDWINFVVSSKARTKIKQSLKEAESKEAEYGKEILQRRFKNRKIEYDDAIQTRLIKKIGYKTATEFYADIASEKLDVSQAITLYEEMIKKETEVDLDARKAENFVVTAPTEEKTHKKEDVLVIDETLKDIDFSLARCCSPIYGDEVFGFVSSHGGIKIHRVDCTNATDMMTRFGYRIVKARWAGKSTSQYPIGIRVVGHDDIGIVTNITSIISKEENVSVRSISIDSHAGLFEGTITVLIGDTSKLDSLIKKIRTVKGVKQVNRIDRN